MNYLHWQEQKITDFSESAVSAMYDRGFVFTRIGKGVMHQTRSCRINLEKFQWSSENRRMIRKGADMVLDDKVLPLIDYSWTIGKVAKDFYEIKASPGTFTANKIKELLSIPFNFNSFLKFSKDNEPLGYAICLSTKELLHYSYPFYDLERAPKDMGMIMMTKTIQWAKENSKKFIYLGSLQRPTDTYKLQFEGLEWFDGKEWQNDLEDVKKILTKTN